jgi:hypothetical protein
MKVGQASETNTALMAEVMFVLFLCMLVAKRAR